MFVQRYLWRYVECEAIPRVALYQSWQGGAISKVAGWRYIKGGRKSKCYRVEIFFPQIFMCGKRGRTLSGFDCNLDRWSIPLPRHTHRENRSGLLKQEPNPVLHYTVVLKQSNL